MLIVVIVILSFFILVGYPVSYLRGYDKGVAAAALPKAIEYECSHVWEKWKPHDIHIYDPQTGRKKYTHSGQQRTCEICGYSKVEKLTAGG
jgi:hypothetical protein